MGTPIYSGAPVPVNRPGQANCGLWYDKFCNEWDANFTKLVENDNGENGKKRWINGMIGPPVGSRSLLEEAHSRRGNMVKRCMGKYVTATTNSALVSGLGRSHPVENGFTWHHTLGVPYLPGSSIKGVVRSWTVWNKDNLHQDDVKRIFGPRGKGAKHVGSVIFLDALPKRPVQLKTEILTPHYAPWYQKLEAPGDWHNPIPIPFLAVAAGQEFCFGIMPRDLADAKGKDDCEQVLKWLMEALEWIGVGAKTAVGMGYFDPPREEVIAIAEEDWSNATLIYNSGQSELVANSADGKKAIGNNKTEGPFVSEDIIARIKKKGSIRASVTVRRAGNSYRIVSVEAV